MSMLVEIAVLAATLFGLLLGGFCIYWVKVCPCPRRRWWGSFLFVGNLLFLGGAALVAAVMHADGLAPVGLLSGMLIVGMLWEGSAAASEPRV